MFLHELQNDFFKTHILSNSRKTTFISVVPERGGIIGEFTVNNNPILYLDKSTLFNEKLSVRGGIPILFPICGSIDNDTYFVENTAYKMKRHGFARLLPWNVSDVKTFEDSASITLEQESSDFTCGQYPFNYKLIYTYTLTDNTLAISSTFVNKDNKELIFYAGFHPYFLIKDKGSTDIDISSESYNDILHDGIVNGKINYQADETNIVYHYPRNNECSIYDKLRNISILLKFDNNFKHFVLWTQKDKDFICMEPWMAYTDALNTKTDLVRLEPGKSLTSQIIIEVK